MSGSAPPTRRFLPQPVETTTKSVRRFSVEPLETTTRSNRQESHDEPMPMDIDEPEPQPKPKRRFLPEPVETSSWTNRAHTSRPAPEPTPEPSPKAVSDDENDEDRPAGPRRFAPQLIETSKRSKRAGDARPATLPTDKTDITPGTNHIYLPRRKLKSKAVVVNAPEDGGSRGSEISPMAPRRQTSMRPHPNTRRSTRSNSFIPELQPIASTGDEEMEDDEYEDDDYEEEDEDGEGTPSLTTSYGSSDDSVMRLQLARTRESCDDRFSGYLLALAAKAAEKQLREQALAAFPNSDYREVVEHFYDREVEPGSEDEEITGTGMLTDDLAGDVLHRKSTGWDEKEMMIHQETLARLREDETNQKVAAEATKPTFKDPFWTNGMTDKGPLAEIKKETEMMQKAASPPMLGADLKFRMCPSPKATKFETDQKVEIKHNKREDGGGLWGGYCVAEEAEQYITPVARGPAMIQTPGIEHDDPFASAFSHELPADGAKSPKHKPNASKGLHMLSGLDSRLKAEAEKSRMRDAFAAEFDDTFVTQVYNYLSLGYPSLAREYDEELAKISRLDEKELSKGDENHVQGYIGIAASGRTDGGNAERTPRWLALRIYIHEWAKQNPSMDGADTTPGAWGVRARRGSWAI